MDHAATQNMQPPPEVPPGSNSASHSPLNNSKFSNQISYQSHGSQQADNSSNSSLHHQPSGSDINTLDMRITEHRVLFLTKRGADYKLSQICIGGLNSHSFFGTLKEEYFRLRGVIRGCFSIWRYSHCDFYKVLSLF
jgi:hypothetical protein